MLSERWPDANKQTSVFVADIHLSLQTNLKPRVLVSVTQVLRAYLLGSIMFVLDLNASIFFFTEQIFRTWHLHPTSLSQEVILVYSVPSWNPRQCLL